MHFCEVDRERAGAELRLVSEEGLWELRAHAPGPERSVALRWRMWPHEDIARFPVSEHEDAARVLGAIARWLEEVDEGAWGWEVALRLPCPEQLAH